MDKPTLPKGTRDFGPAQMAKRQFIFNTIRKVFENYGFQPLETPAMENLTTLQGKYGDEGDQLLFKVLDSGDYFDKTVVKLKDALNDFLRSIILDYFNSPNIEDSNQSREGLENLIDEFADREAWVSSRYLDSYQKVNFKQFITEERSYLTSEIRDFINRAQLWKANFDQKKFDNNFRQFRDNDFNGRVLPNALKYLRLKVEHFTADISEKGLKYDLTVPFARYVVMNRSDIAFPFKRYQIQPVWRADRPQKGRYREFYQCDADVVGTDSLICEAEIILMIKEVFEKLQIDDYEIKINHRSILNGMFEWLDLSSFNSQLLIAIDKLDKVGKEKVKEDLISQGLNETKVQALFDEFLNPGRSFEQKLGDLRLMLLQTKSGAKGVEDIGQLMTFIESYGSNLNHVVLDTSLARGLSYYTGCIFEVKINNVAIGSVSGGGRYDNLTAVFDSKEKSSGVGISFGVDRLYDAMEELGAFKDEILVSSKVFICHANESCRSHALSIVKALRDQGVASEVYPDVVKLQKQFDYVNRRKIPFSLTIDPGDIATGTYTFKNMKTGDRQKLTLTEILSKF